VVSNYKGVDFSRKNAKGELGILKAIGRRSQPEKV